MTIGETISIAKAAGFTGTGLIKAVAIAIAESALNPDATGDEHLQTIKWGPSVGLWQIRTLKPAYLYMEPIRNIATLYNPQQNAIAAFAISKGGTDFSPWSTYTSDAYKKFTDSVSGALQYVSENKFPIMLIAATAALYYYSNGKGAN